MDYEYFFRGTFTIDKPVDPETYKLLVGLASTKRMCRDVDAAFGTYGEFYIEEGNLDNITNADKPPGTQPTQWCRWLIQDDMQTIQYKKGDTIFDCYTQWITYLVDRVLKPRGYVVNGNMQWWGRTPGDEGTIKINDNEVKMEYD